MTGSARAAVLGSTEQPMTAAGGLDAFPSFSPDGRRDVSTSVVLLPQGLRAAALGRTILRLGAPEWAEAGLGPVQRVESKLPNWAAIVLSVAGKGRFLDDLHIPGPIDIPVWFDPATDTALGVDVETLLAEVAPERDTAVRIWRDEDSYLRAPRFLLSAPKKALHLVRDLTGTWRREISNMAADMRSTPPAPADGERPTDASHPPIEGVGYRTWVTVRAGLVRDEVHPTHVDLYAGYRGVPAGRWPAVDAAWAGRAAGDARLQTWSGFDVRRLEPTGARW